MDNISLVECHERRENMFERLGYNTIAFIDNHKGQNFVEAALKI